MKSTPEESAAFMNDDRLAERGLKRVIKYSCIFWDETNGWTHELEDSEEIARFNGGYGNFAGMSKVTCIVPIDA